MGGHARAAHFRFWRQHALLPELIGHTEKALCLRLRKSAPTAFSDFTDRMTVRITWATGITICPERARVPRSLRHRDDAVLKSINSGGQNQLSGKVNSDLGFAAPGFARFPRDPIGSIGDRV